MTKASIELCAEFVKIFEEFDDQSNLLGVLDELKSNGNNLLERAKKELANQKLSKKHKIARAVYDNAMLGLSEFKKYWPVFEKLPTTSRHYKQAFVTAAIILEIMQPNDIEFIEND